MKDDAKPLLVFFWSERSGPARRMESLLAHVKGKRVVGRIDGRASAPKIEDMLAPHLAAAAA